MHGTTTTHSAPHLCAWCGYEFFTLTGYVVQGVPVLVCKRCATQLGTRNACEVGSCGHVVAAGA